MKYELTLMFQKRFTQICGLWSTFRGKICMFCISTKQMLQTYHDVVKINIVHNLNQHRFSLNLEYRHTNKMLTADLPCIVLTSHHRLRT